MDESTLLDQLKAAIRQQFARQGGLARAAALTPEERAKISSKAGRARWKTTRRAKKKKAR